MNILMLLYNKFPRDIRVEKEAKSLINAGHNVFLIAQDNYEHLKNINGIKVLYLKNYYIDLFFFILNFKQPILVNKIRDIIVEYKINAIHIHDLPLVNTGYVAAKKFNIPVIADLHENYPAAVKFYQNKKITIKELFKKIFLNYKRCRRYELRILKKVDKIIIVVPESYKRFKGIIPKHKFSIVSNTVDIENFKNKKIDKKLTKKYKGKFIISYIGSFGPHRGIDTSIKAMQYINNNKIILLLIGGKGNYIKEMKKLVKKLKVEEKVNFINWVPFDSVQDYIEVSNVCLVPHNNSEHTQTTIPHKLFQCMYLKKPVLVSNCAPLKRIVEETGAGLIFRAGSPKDFAKKINQLFNSKSLCNYGNKGFNAILSKYNWDIEGNKLIKIYKSL